MRALLEEYGITLILIILSSGILSVLLYILNYITSGAIWFIWS